VLRLPGPLSTNQARLVVAYFGCGANASPRLAAPPVSMNDFATAELGRAWDFEDGSQCGIANWGNRAGDFGPIAVKNVWLQFRSKQRPYFIFATVRRGASPATAHRLVRLPLPTSTIGLRSLATNRVAVFRHRCRRTLKSIAFDYRHAPTISVRFAKSIPRFLDTFF
jgi:hypothetical protein